jgi:hypothetical protein
MDQQAAGVVQQHSHCRCHVSETQVAARRAAPELVSSEREQRSLCKSPQKLRRRICITFVATLHSRASTLHVKRAFFILNKSIALGVWQQQQPLPHQAA